MQVFDDKNLSVGECVIESVCNFDILSLLIVNFDDDVQVDDMTADYIISQLLFLDAEDSTKDIKLFINSPGGSITAGTSRLGIERHADL